MNDYHIPHIQFSQWYVEGKSTDEISDLLSKTGNRNFGIRFHLMDPNANTTYVHIKFDEPLDFHVKKDDRFINFYFEKNDEDFLSSILVGMTESTPIHAFETAYFHVSTTLSTFSFFFRRAFKIWQVDIHDGDLIIGTRFHCPMPITLKKINPASFSLDSPIGSLFALYREGINSTDLAYRYINFFKIYECWYKDEFVFKNIRKEYKKPELKIDKELLLGCYREQYHDEFIGKKFNDFDAVFIKLRHIRNLISHPFLNRELPDHYMNIDGFKFRLYLEFMTNLIERISTKILEEELKLLSGREDDIKKLLESYNSSSIENN